MAQDGDTITYTFSGSKVTEDISNIEEITIDRMDGADSELSSGANGGSGGLIEGAIADVSSYNTLEIWVGQTHEAQPNSHLGGFGRINGGDGQRTFNGQSGAGGGSTELWVDSESTFIAAADAGGGGGYFDDGGFFSSSTSNGGGGGARGGTGGSGSGGDANDDGNDAGGTGFGGDGGNATSSGGENGGDGGQELGIASGGTTTKGGSTDGDGEITLSFTGSTAPAAPSNLQLSLQ